MQGAALAPALVAKRVLLELFDFPYMHVRKLLAEMPIFAGVALCGALVLFHRSSVHQDGGQLLYLVGFVGVLVAIGVLRQRPLIFRHLYLVYPFMLTIGAWLVFASCDRVLGRWWRKESGGSKRRMLVLLISVAVAILAFEQHSFTSAWRIGQRDYSTPVRNKFFHYPRHPAHKPGALYIRGARKAGDIVVAMDMLSHLYLGKIDYLIEGEEILEGKEVLVDLFLGVPVLREVQSLEKIVQARRSNNVWLITSIERVGPHRRAPGVSDGVVRYLEHHGDKVVFAADDGTTRVYRWPAIR